jgi:hypothetical protein
MTASEQRSTDTVDEPSPTAPPQMTRRQALTASTLAVAVTAAAAYGTVKGGMWMLDQANASHDQPVTLTKGKKFTAEDIAGLSGATLENGEIVVRSTSGITSGGALALGMPNCDTTLLETTEFTFGQSTKSTARAYFGTHAASTFLGGLLVQANGDGSFALSSSLEMIARSSVDPSQLRGTIRLVIAKDTDHDAVVLAYERRPGWRRHDESLGAWRLPKQVSTLSFSLDANVGTGAGRAELRALRRSSTSVTRLFDGGGILTAIHGNNRTHDGRRMVFFPARDLQIEIIGQALDQAFPAHKPLAIA